MCTGCGRTNGIRVVQGGSFVRPKQMKKVNMESVIVGKSKNPEVKVALVYRGGGMVKQKWTPGCSSCGGNGQYALLTSETIMFASDDAPNGMFKLFVQAGRTYYVTEEQAKYLLAITFINQSGQEVNKFTKVER